MDNSGTCILRLYTLPAFCNREVGFLTRSKSFTPSSPKSPPISPKNDTSLGPFGKLSEDVIVEIFSYLPYPDLHRISRICRIFRRIANDKTLPLDIEKKHQQALKVMREGIPICIGFYSQSLKGMLDNRVKLNPGILKLHGSDYIKALQNCEFTQKAIIDENGYLCAIAKPERIRNLKAFILVKDPMASKTNKIFPSEARNEFKIKSFWESGRYKLKQNEEAEEDSPRSPQSRSTWKLQKLEFMGDHLTHTQKKVIERALKELNSRPIETIIRTFGELKFVEGQDNF